MPLPAEVWRTRPRHSNRRPAKARNSSRNLVIAAIALLFVLQLRLVARITTNDDVSSLDNQFTVRLNTYQRPLRTVVQHYLSCPQVAQLQVVWSEPAALIPDWVWSHDDDRLVVEVHDTKSLHNRFQIRTPPPTTAILSTDDDIVASCGSLAAAFAEWKNAPQQLVGYHLRVHREDDVTMQWTYHSVPWYRPSYSLTLTKLAFLHRQYLYSYEQHLPRRIVEYVDEHRNCEDIAMSLWISQHNDGAAPLSAPLWALLRQWTIGNAKGISDEPSHAATRNECLDLFATELGLKGKLQTRRLYPVWMRKLGW